MIFEMGGKSPAEPNKLLSKIIWASNLYTSAMGGRFQKLLNTLRGFNLPKGEYAVFGSGPLAIRGLRSTKDLDVVVSRKLWEKLSKDRKVIDFKHNKEVELAPGIEALLYLSTFGVDMEKAIRNAEIINGLPFISLEDLIAAKEKMGRDKDFRDIYLVREYLRSR